MPINHLPSLAKRTAPGLALSLAVSLVAVLAEMVETRLFGRAWLENLVLAILFGTLVRTLFAPDARFKKGIDVSAKLLLEIAVVLLGLSVSARAIVSAGPWLMVGIAGVVICAIAISYAIGRGLGLSHKLSVLIACGNSICGNSAIAATAPVIHAEGDDVASSIAFTAVLGVVVVLVLPPLAALFGLTTLNAGIFAGLTVYAVPQVIAATAPIGTLAVQMGTLVKLVRVLMLGPVVLVLSLATRDPAAARLRPSRLVPWFILGFLGMIAVRSSGFVPPMVLAPAAATANLLTIVSMAALGLCVDIRTVASAGPRVVGTVVLSLLALGGLGLGLIAVLPIG